MRDFSILIKDLSRRVDEASVYLRVDQAREEAQQLETEAGDPKLWDDQDRARDVTSKLSSLKSDIEVVESLHERISDIETLYELMREAGDEALEAEIDQLCSGLEKQLDQLELRSLFTGEYDCNFATIFCKDAS